jgi:MerR family copper efflux transcriptional regulator
MPESGERRERPMTVGELSRLTGVPVKALRSYTDWGLIYTVGRSLANYRLYDADALWCVRLITELRGLGLTVAELRDLLGGYSADDHRSIGPSLAERLSAARARVDVRIADLDQTRRRIDAFTAAHRAELAGENGARLWTDDPRRSGPPA